jgi:hypothetical protein
MRYGRVWPGSGEIGIIGRRWPGALLTGPFLVLAAIAGLALTLVVFGINLLGDGLTTAWNPRLREGRGPGTVP